MCCELKKIDPICDFDSANFIGCNSINSINKQDPQYTISIQLSV